MSEEQHIDTRMIVAPSYTSAMVAEIAMGMHEPADIAYRYGISRSEFALLEKNTAFCAEVATKRAEYERGGQTVKMKAQLMTENLMDDMFLRAKHPQASLGQIQDTVKILAKLGDLEPKNNAQVVAPGGGTSVQIIFNGSAAAVTIGSENDPKTTPKMISDVFDVDMSDLDLEDKPEHLP